MATDPVKTFTDFFNVSFEKEAKQKIIPDKSEGDYYFNGRYIPIQKDQLRVGSILHYCGKDEPNTRWEVWRIWYSLGSRRYSHSKVFTEKDQIILFCQNNMSNRKSVSFRHISKSPLWRLQW
jgi:hypothetical protein